jgi:hypothetical protein
MPEPMARPRVARTASTVASREARMKAARFTVPPVTDG